MLVDSYDNILGLVGRMPLLGVAPAPSSRSAGFVAACMISVLADGLIAATAHAEDAETAAAPAVSAPAGRMLSFLGLEGTIPAAWIPEEPATRMRLAQCRVPGKEAGQFVVFYFGPRQGGTTQANIDRWTAQFSSASGEPVVPVVTSFDSAGMTVTLAEFAGTYRRGIGMGSASPARPDQMLLGAVLESPRGKVFIQLFGPAATVRANRAGFERFLRGLRSTSP